MILEIIKPDSHVFTGENIALVQLPGLDGSFEILANHAPMISALKKGRIKVVDGTKQTLYFDIKGGVVEILQNKVLVLAE
ncbi:MAG: F0F1 ATP synthase subunit epsilon [Bacteroidales bacterium]|nr:F0F1 ATP synthase subunit epsilon [Bacteroidales bacterium]MDD3663821.1 F0F1 ATP synthase subunit epsilon [Bacteroidales bacterium]